jgi:nitroreductase
MPVSSSFPMPQLSRRKLLIGAGSATALLAPAGEVQANGSAELCVTDALRSRRSTRAFAERGLDAPLIAEILWAAVGVNRPDTGLRTAPSWYGAADVGLYVATADGVQSYDPVSNSVARVMSGDIRKALSPQAFVATAPACLIFISDLAKLSAAPSEDEKRLWSTVNAAIAAQNVYVFAAARGLGTCLVGGLDREAIRNGLSLTAQDHPTFVQPIGWPA